MDKSIVSKSPLTSATRKLSRDSNLELFRIITMLLIVAHHYVVNSGLTVQSSALGQNPLSLKALVLLVFGAWGKVGINCFVLITGYFMCKSQITVKKFLQLLLEVMFYRIAIYLIFLISGYSSFSLMGLVKLLIPVTEVNKGFTNAFIIFYLFIPFLGMFVQKLNERNHFYLLLLSFFTYVVLGSFAPVLDIEFNYITWYTVLFFIASYIRLYPKKLFENTKFWGFATLICIVLGVGSVIGSTFAGTKIGMWSPYYFLGESNRILAVITGISAFLFFKNLKIKPNRFINTVAASTFAVLLIHSNSQAMRTWLWYDTLDVLRFYETNFVYVHAILSVIAIFVVCVCIDYLRILLLERPFMKLFDKGFPKIKEKYMKIEKALFKKLNIE